MKIKCSNCQEKYNPLDSGYLLIAQDKNNPKFKYFHNNQCLIEWVHKNLVE